MDEESGVIGIAKTNNPELDKIRLDSEMKSVKGLKC